jgi:mono/diheme cytochrome c family protein
MNLRAGIVSVVILFLVVFAMGCSKAEAPKPAATPAAPAVSAAAEGKALFEQKCGVCHGLDRATARQETKESWSGIIKTMQGKKADWISDADGAKIVEFLASQHGKK